MIAARRLSDQFDWRREPYEFVSDRLAIDLLFGSEGPRKMIEADASTDDVVATFAAPEKDFADRRRPYLLYP